MLSTRTTIWSAALGLFVLLLASGCDTGVEPSPEPGVFRLMLKADPADSVIVIGQTRYALGSGTATQGFIRLDARGARLFHDSTYAELMRTLVSFSVDNPRLDLLAVDEEGQLRQHVLYESYVPPAVYDSLQIELRVEQFRVSKRQIDSVFVPIGDSVIVRVDTSTISFSNEVRLARGLSPVQVFGEDIRVTGRDTTVMWLEIEPLRSLTRVQDIYEFRPRVRVIDIEHREAR